MSVDLRSHSAKNSNPSDAREEVPEDQAWSARHTENDRSNGVEWILGLSDVFSVLTQWHEKLSSHTIK